MTEHSLLLDAIVYLVAAVVFVPLASRFKLGSVLGYLIAGCVIGPFGLRLVRDVESTMHFAEMGVVLMLFVIGLELEPSRLIAMRRRVFGGGALQMLVCGAGLVAGGALLGVAVPREASVALPFTGALVAGLAMALSSTAIAIQTLKERGALASPMGQGAFGILLFQDIAAIPLVGIVPLLGVSEAHSGGGWIGLAKVAAAVVGVVFVGQVATRPVLRGLARLDQREVFTAFALLLVLGVAQIMHLAGVSMALGAFLAGVLLAGSEYRHALETDIEPFKGLLMGLFFMGVGMSIDFGLLAAHPILVAALVIGFVVIKTGALLLLAPTIGVPAGERWLFAAVLSQGGEFAFVVFKDAGAAQLLPGDWEKVLTLVVALSMAATPLLLLLGDAWARRHLIGPQREADVIETDEAPVIIAGFGRFGQIVGRLLFASGLRATVLDYDPDQIELLRKFGFRIFYGDATRLDLLHAAGAGKAKVLVNAIDDVESNLRLVDLVKQHFPQVQIVARARNVTHYMDLRERGVTLIERELFDSALIAGRRALEALGVHRYEARERAEAFRRHNLASLEAVRTEMSLEQRVVAAREARDQLTRQFQRDLEALHHPDGSHGWHRDEDREATASARGD